MRSALLASLLIACIAPAALAQILYEYRPEIILTLPRVHGYGVQLVLDDRISMDDVIPNERIMGVGVISPVMKRIAVAFEARYVRERDGFLEHRYVPTVYFTQPLPGGFELRNRNRFEFRDFAGKWSRRYINRSTVGRDVEFVGHPYFPYLQGDAFFDTRYNVLNRHDVTVGVRTPIWGATSIDPFFTRTIDIRRTPRLAITTGALLRVPL